MLNYPNDITKEVKTVHRGKHQLKQTEVVCAPVLTRGFQLDKEGFEFQCGRHVENLNLDGVKL